MSRKKKSAVRVRKYGTKSNYSLKNLEEALEKIKTGKMSQRNAAIHYKIPRSTIKYKLKGQHSKPIGKPITFSESEENVFLCHITALADLGIPVGMHDVRLIIKKYLDDEGKTVKAFKNNMPGWDWGKHFLDRHPDIKQRIAHNVVAGKSVSVEQIQKYIEEREESEKKTKKSTTKRRRPVESKHGKAKMAKTSHHIDDPQPSRSGQKICVNAANENVNNYEEEDDDENSLNDGNIYSDTEELEEKEEYRRTVEECEERLQEAEIMQEEEMGLDRAHEEHYTIEIFEVIDGTLKLETVNMVKAVGLFCIINYEGTLYPGRITLANHPKYKVSVMQKADEGWIWPASVQIYSVNDANIIRMLNDTNIQRKNDYYAIEDDFLTMEWGD